MHAYVINLDCRPERMAYMRPQLERLGIDYTRISAINGLKDEAVTIARTRKKISGPERACYKSHLKAYAAFLDSGENHGLILEDDMALSATLPAALTCLAKAPMPAAIVRLEIPIQSITGEASRVSYRSIALDKPFKLVRLLSDVYGLGAYIINRETAQRILAGYPTPEIPIDGLLLCKNDIMPQRPRVFQLDPPQAIQNRFLDGNLAPNFKESDIEDSRLEIWGASAIEDAARVKTKLTSRFFLVRILNLGLANIVRNSTTIYFLIASPLTKFWKKIAVRQQLFYYRDSHHQIPIKK